MVKFTALACAVAAVATLAGCASVHRTYDDSDLAYDPTLSRAKNLAFSPVFRDLKDVEAPEGVKLDDDGSYLLNTAAWTGNMLSASGSFLPGTSNFGSALGIGLGISMIGEIFRQPPTASLNATYGYVPLDQATSSEEARKLYMERLVQVLEDSAKKMFPTAKVEKGFYFVKKTWLTDDVLTGGIEIVDEKMGCRPYGDETAREDTCSIWFTHKLPGVPTTGTHPAFGPSIQAWRTSIGTFDIYGGKKQGIDWAKLLVSCTDSLPPYTVIYVTSQEAPDGTRNPPMILEKGRINFFVKPKAEQK